MQFLVYFLATISVNEYETMANFNVVVRQWFFLLELLYYEITINLFYDTLILWLLVWIYIYTSNCRQRTKYVFKIFHQKDKTESNIGDNNWWNFLILRHKLRKLNWHNKTYCNNFSMLFLINILICLLVKLLEHLLNKLSTNYHKQPTRREIFAWIKTEIRGDIWL